MAYPYNALTRLGSAKAFGQAQSLHIGLSASATSPDGQTGALFWLPQGPVTLSALLSWANLIDDPGHVEIYSTSTGFVVAVIDVAATTTPTMFSDTGTCPIDDYYGVRAICESANTITLHGVYLEFSRERVADITWQDVTAQTGYTFTRASTATDGSPEVGLPADDVDSYSTNVLRNVSGKTGLTHQYLLEGSRTNLLLRSNDLTNASWVTTGTVTRTGSQTDPAGGTEACRLEAASGSNLVNQTVVGNPVGVPRVQSQWVRQGPGSGAYAFLASNPFNAVGGTALTTWARDSVVGTSTNASWAHRTVDASNLLAFGGPAAGARDAINAWPQMERGDFASSFISTAGSSATRDADNLRCTFPASWASRTLVVEYIPQHNRQHVIDGLQVSLLAVDADTYLFYINEDAGTARLLVTDGVAIAQVLLPDFVAGDALRFEANWTTQQVRMYQNGVFSSASYFIGGVANWSGAVAKTAYIGRDSGGTVPCWGLVRIGVI